MNLRSQVRFLSFIVFFMAGISLLSAQTLLPPEQPYAIRGSAGIGAWPIPANAALEFSGGFTIESWICPRAMGWTWIWSKQNADSYGMWLHCAWGGIEFCDTDNPSQYYRPWLSAPINRPLGTWMHVAVTVSVSGEIFLYFDGVQVGHNINFPDASRHYGNWVINPSFVGSQAQFRMWNRVLTPYEIQTNATRYLTGNESGLVAYWPCDDGPGADNGGLILRDLGPNQLTITRTNDLAGAWDSGSTRWLRTSVLNSGPYFAVERRHEAEVSPSYSKGAFIDFDLDGRLDFVVAPELGPGPLKAYHIDDQGQFSDVTAAVLVSNALLYGPIDFLTADFNGDGLKDLFISDVYRCDGTGGRNYLFIQMPGGQLVDESTTRIPFMGAVHNQAASAGDIDGDGDIDLFLTIGSWNCGFDGMRTSRFLLNDGQGYFVEATGRIPAIYEENNRISIARLADVDKDGDLDLILGTLNGFPWSPLPQDRILLNDGTGNYTEAPSTTMPEHLFPNGFSDSMEVADFNGDGYPDILMGVASTYGNDSAGRLRLLLNKGDGTYEDSSDKISILYPQDGGYFVRKIFVGDFNGDGWLDFGSTMQTGWGMFRQDLFFNNGDGYFEESMDLVGESPNANYPNPGHLAWDPMWGFAYRGVIVGDIDGDADTDILAFRASEYLYIFRNIKPWPTAVPLDYPSEADLISPQNASDNLTLPILKWTGVVTAGSYQLQVATDQYFNNFSFDRDGLTCSSHQPATLIKGKTYYWRVRAINTRGAGAWSEVWSFYYGDIIPYTFEGFFPPIENLPVVNQAKAGQAIPIKWRITDKNGLPISDPESFINITSYNVNCASFEGDPTNSVEEVAAGNSGLQYLGDGWWQFNWKTAKSYMGQCRVMKLTLDDKSEHTASFRFK